MPSLTAHLSEGLAGSLRVPGDKSISHRALMLAALAVGESTIDGLLEGEDVMRTAAALSALGAETARGPDGRWHVWGRGIGGLREPEQVLDLGNSGTGVRLLMGILAAHPMTATLTGDASLISRPMARVAEPLALMGAGIRARDGGRLPLTITGSDRLRPVSYRLPVPSAQVKSAVLLAGLGAPGITEVIEAAATRDHSERLMGHFGAAVRVSEEGDGRRISLTGQPELAARPVSVPGDPSSAAFPLVAALITPGSEISLPGLGLNPLRTGLIETLKQMGARIQVENAREESGEPVGDLRVASSTLEGVEVPAGRAPSMIDEYPILAVAAACARGTTLMHGLGELRVKESDRLGVVARGLAACGVAVEEGPDSLTVHGTGAAPRGGAPLGGAVVASELDHRIAMSFLVLGLASERSVTIDDDAPIETSFPGFTAAMAGIGAHFTAGPVAG
jgi:3-phosphoshikimate 1-carboxyvinyltransferase